MRLWIGLLIGSFAAGQSTGRIEGHVLSQSGEAVRKATVRLQANSPAQAGPAARPITYVEISDAGGKFVFEELPPGRYTLAATRTGYTPPRTSGFNASITLQAGEVKTDAEIRLIQLGVISGHVTDQDGDPAIGVQVQALHVQYNGGRRQLTPYTTIVSDDQGNFRIANVEPGRYYPVVDDSRRAIASIVGDERRGRTAQEVDITTFYPSSPDFSSAVAVEVSAGKEAQGVNIRMLRGRVFSIRGTALDGRTAATGMQLTLMPKASGLTVANNRIGTQVQGSTGAFEFRGLPPGTYVIQGQRGQQVTRAAGDAVTSTPALAGRIEVSVANSDVDGVVLALSAPAEITGTIRMEEGGRVDPNAHVTLMDSDGSTPNLSAATPLNADGMFRIQNVGLSRYSVNVSPLPADSYVKSIRFGGQDVTKTPIDLTSGAGGTLDIILSQKAAEVTALAHRSNGEPAAGVAISIWPKAATFDPATVRIVNTPSTGSVKVSGMAPGEYYMAAWEDVDASLLRYPDFVAQFADVATELRLSENDKVRADLTLLPKEKIAAEVAKLP